MEAKTLSHQIEDHLTMLIFDSVLAPGQPLGVEALCEEYGYTRTPLREALRCMAANGLVDHAPNRGYRVPKLDPEALAIVYEIREALEGIAARLLARRITAEQIAELERLDTECERLGRADAANRKAKQAGLEIHRKIALWCGNSLISKILVAPQVLLQGMMPPPGVHGPWVVEVYDHAAIVRPIVAGDPEQAEAAMRQHIRYCAGKVLGELRKKEVTEVGDEQLTLE